MQIYFKIPRYSVSVYGHLIDAWPAGTYVCMCAGIAVITVGGVEQLAVQLAAIVPELINIAQCPHCYPTDFRIPKYPANRRYGELVRSPRTIFGEREFATDCLRGACVITLLIGSMGH